MFRLRTYDEVTSTNDLVKRALEEGEPEGLAVGARVQTAGYGRQGRAWKSPEGGMYVSLLLRPQVPPAQLPTLSLVVGMAVRRALVALAPGAAERVKIKWPNDVVCTSARAAEGAPLRLSKLCGISLESHAGGICVGIGVNVLLPRDAGAPAVGGKNVPAYLSELVADASGAPGAPDERSAPDIPAVRAAVLEALSELYLAWTAHGFGPLLPEYAAHAALDGLRVSVENLDGSPVAEGVARGVDAWGRLLVEPPLGGDFVAVSSGEAHISSVR
ncbi:MULTISPECIES: biotin--[acetyl-CoA-carboxylase] ligase [unclassified Adlercreutzia]|uniref:biotin--[acetyl-CoA-carboxylase] ligase n=1 Tax=unclassified Adlercreutzia TaxID=2636013 RepID=UPI0013EA9F54|nr:MULTISPECIES: biotin--[acetyl-CoA-carboxylase] ligase [unclassified Adlercreutzia]